MGGFQLGAPLHDVKCVQENTEIPDSVIDAVKAEFKKTRTTTRAEIKPSKVREFLKKLKLNKYYEHTNAICNMLNGVPAPRLSHELEEKLKAMFAEIQEPFEKNCPANRKNFLSYGYTLYKFCELLGEGKGLHGIYMVLFRGFGCFGVRVQSILTKD